MIAILLTSSRFAQVTPNCSCVYGRLDGPHGPRASPPWQVRNSWAGAVATFTSQHGRISVKVLSHDASLFSLSRGRQAVRQSIGQPRKKAGIQTRTSRHKGTKCHLIPKGWQSFSFDVSFGADDKAPQPVNGHGPAHPPQGTCRAARASKHKPSPSLTPDCACLQSDQVFRTKARFVRFERH